MDGMLVESLGLLCSCWQTTSGGRGMCCDSMQFRKHLQARDILVYSHRRHQQPASLAELWPTRQWQWGNAMHIVCMMGNELQQPPNHRMVQAHVHKGRSMTFWGCTHDPI